MKFQSYFIIMCYFHILINNFFYFFSKCISNCRNIEYHTKFNLAQYIHTHTNVKKRMVCLIFILFIFNMKYESSQIANGKPEIIFLYEKLLVPLGAIIAAAIGVPLFVMICLFIAIWFQELGIFWIEFIFRYSVFGYLLAYKRISF